MPGFSTLMRMSTQLGANPSNSALPATWPSAWPSLGRNVALGAVLPIVAAIVVLVILLLTKSLSTAWWVALLPLLLLAWPLSLPARARKVMQDAGDSGRLEIVNATLGTLARAPQKRLGVQPTAEVVPGRPVRYHVGAAAARPR